MFNVKQKNIVFQLTFRYSTVYSQVAARGCEAHRRAWPSFPFAKQAVRMKNSWNDTETSENRGNPATLTSQRPRLRCAVAYTGAGWHGGYVARVSVQLYTVRWGRSCASVFHLEHDTNAKYSQRARTARPTTHPGRGGAHPTPTRPARVDVCGSGARVRDCQTTDRTHADPCVLTAGRIARVPPSPARTAPARSRGSSAGWTTSCGWSPRCHPRPPRPS